jgi:hypothetical protein
MSIENELQIIFKDIKDCSEQLEQDRRAFFKRFPFIPPSISVGNGRVIFISQNSENAVIRISRTLRENSLEYQAATSEKEMNNLVSRAIGELLAANTDDATTKFDIPTDAITFKRDLRQCIENKFSQLRINRTHLFGAWVLQGEAIPSLVIGPVRFLLRDLWLEEVVKSGLVTQIRADRISSLWKEVNPERGKINDINDAWDDAVADSVGPCPWVCVVDVSGHSDERSREKAILAARIGLATIGLSWNRPSRETRQTGLLFDLGPHRSRATVAYRGDKFISANHESVLRLGRFLSASDASGFLSDTAAQFQTVGNALDTFLTVEATGPKAKLEATLCRALVWFHEACREPLDFLAIVKFAAALDTLAAGSYAKGICELVENRFPVKDMNAQFLTDGTSAKELVEQIYNTGRSRIVHGTRPSVFEDLNSLRSKAELLTTSVLRACVHWLRDYSGLDDVNAYRKA